MRNGNDYIPQEEEIDGYRRNRRNGNHSDRRASGVPDRLPPHSPEAEMGILGSIILDPSFALPLCIERLNDGLESFYDLRHQEIYRTFIELFEDGVPIDLITTQDRLKTWQKLERVGGLTYLSCLPDTSPSSSNVEQYIQIVREKNILRKMIRACYDVVSSIYDNDGDVDGLLDQCEAKLLSISESRVSVQPETMHTLVQQVLSDFDQAAHGHGIVTGVSSGFIDLDKLTQGFQPGTMNVIAARPSIGKTSLAINIADYAAVECHLPVGIISLEMTRKQLVNRMLCSRARVNMRNIREGFITQRDTERIAAAAAALHNAPVYIDDTSGLSVLQIRAKLRRWWQQHQIRLGIIDYLQLSNAIGGGRKFESRQQEVSQISCGIKSMAKEFGIPIIVLSQLNREFDKEKNRKPRLSDLRESGAIEQDADFVGFLYRPKDDENDYDAAEAQPVNLLVAKQRDGISGLDVHLTFLKPYTRFENAAAISDNDEPAQQQLEPEQQAGLPYQDQ